MKPTALCAVMALAVVALAGAAQGRLMLQSHVARRALQQTGGSMASTVVVPIDTKLSLYNISGTWVGVGDQFDASVWAAYFEENKLPSCGAVGNFTYKHWDVTLPDTLAIAVDGEQGIGINGHETGTYLFKNVSYDGQLLKYYADYEPETEACAHYTPYVDARDGFVYGRMVSVTEWRDVNGTVEFTELGCSAKGDEIAGCYPQEDGSVQTVSVTTYRCKAGQCANYSPAVVEKLEE